MFDSASLRTQDEVELRRLWESYNKAAPSNPWLDLALERIHRSFFSSAQNEKVVDYTTIFEILYASDGGSELKFKLSTRAAFLLEQEKERRIAVHDLLALMYDVRSSLVHSGEIPKNRLKKIERGYKDMAGFMSQVEKVLFDSLRHFMLHPETREGIAHILFQ